MDKISYSMAALAMSLILGSPEAGRAQATHPPPLKPGHSAGVQKAQQTHAGLALIGTGAILAIVVVAATTNGNGNGSSNQMNPQVSTTTTTP